MTDLTGAFALVTGAARGIGRAIGVRLAQDGFAVGVADQNHEGAVQTTRLIEGNGGRALAIELDVTDYAAVTATVKQVVSEFGRIDVLVNNAGWDSPGHFVRSDPAIWQKVVAINFMGVVNCSHAVLEPMLAAGRGVIVSVASDAGRVGSAGESVYSGAKGGVIAFSKGIARELARSNIRVNTVCPGPTDTPLITEAFEGKQGLVDAVTRSIPMGRMASSAEIAAAVAFLASADANFITGQTISVNGGLTMC